MILLYFNLQNPEIHCQTGEQSFVALLFANFDNMSDRGGTSDVKLPPHDGYQRLAFFNIFGRLQLIQNLESSTIIRMKEIESSEVSFFVARSKGQLISKSFFGVFRASLKNNK